MHTPNFDCDAAVSSLKFEKEELKKKIRSKYFLENLSCFRTRNIFWFRLVNMKLLLLCKQC